MEWTNFVILKNGAVFPKNIALFVGDKIKLVSPDDITWGAMNPFKPNELQEFVVSGLSIPECNPELKPI